MKRSRSLKPYATITANLLATQRLRRLSGPALQVWLWANAKWTPGKRVGLPSKSLPAKLGMNRATFCDALKELREQQLLTLSEPAIRPGSAGSANGPKCAVYDLPQRRYSAQQRFECGDPKRQGAWRVDALELADIAASVRGMEVRVLVCAVLPHDRAAKTGAVQDCANAKMTAATITNSLASAGEPSSLRSVQRALVGLADRGLVRCIEPAAGRAPAVYVPHGVAAFGRSRHERQRSHGHGSTRGLSLVAQTPDSAPIAVRPRSRSRHPKACATPE